MKLVYVSCLNTCPEGNFAQYCQYVCVLIGAHAMRTVVEFSACDIVLALKIV